MIDGTALEHTHLDQFPAEGQVDRNAIEAGSGGDESGRPPRTIVSGLPKRQWKLHNDLGHDMFSKRTLRRDGDYRRCDAIIDSLEIPEWARQYALRRVMRENLNRWNRHNGIHGAVVGFVCLDLFETEEEAQESWVAERAAEVVPDLSKLSVTKLLRYAFGSESEAEAESQAKEGAG